jgi:hypothetical protein
VSNDGGDEQATTDQDEILYIHFRLLSRQSGHTSSGTGFSRRLVQ